MRIISAGYERGRLTLETPDIQEAMRFAYTFKEGEYQLQKAKKRRSLDANAYCWVLLDKLSAALGIPKEELYRNSIQKIGGVSEIICVPTQGVERLCRSWERNGLGWQTEAMPSKLPGCTTLILYYGSSTFDTAQMSRLIDHIVQDCHALEIETKPQEEIASLLEAWE